MLLVQTQIPTDFHRSCSVFFGMVNPVTSSIRFSLPSIDACKKTYKKAISTFCHQPNNDL